MKGGPIVNSTPTFEDSDDSDSSDEEKAIEKDLLNKSNDSGKEEESEEKDGELKKHLKLQKEVQNQAMQNMDMIIKGKLS